jgi:hypothetical protein
MYQYSLDPFSSSYQRPCYGIYIFYLHVHFMYKWSCLWM